MDTPVLLRGDRVIESLAPSFGESDDNPHSVVEGGVAGVQQAVPDVDPEPAAQEHVEELAVDGERVATAFVRDAPGT